MEDTGTTTRPARPDRAGAERSGVDGRTTRRVRNKTAVIDAFLDLVAEGVESPSVAEVADRSQVSHRSVFRYFADKDDLARTSIERQMERVRPLLDMSIDTGLPLPDRVRTLVETRFNAFRALEPFARLMRQRARVNPAVASMLRDNREFVRAHIRAALAPELAVMDAAGSDDLVAVIDVLGSFEGQDLFTNDLGFADQRVIEVVSAAVLSVLAAAGQPSPNSLTSQ